MMMEGAAVPSATVWAVRPSGPPSSNARLIVTAVSSAIAALPFDGGPQSLDGNLEHLERLLGTHQAGVDVDRELLRLLVHARLDEEQRLEAQPDLAQLALAAIPALEVERQPEVVILVAHLAPFTNVPRMFRRMTPLTACQKVGANAQSVAPGASHTTNPATMPIHKNCTSTAAAKVPSAAPALEAGVFSFPSMLTPHPARMPGISGRPGQRATRACRPALWMRRQGS